MIDIQKSFYGTQYYLCDFKFGKDFAPALIEKIENEKTKRTITNVYRGHTENGKMVYSQTPDAIFKKKESQNNKNFNERLNFNHDAKADYGFFSEYFDDKGQRVNWYGTGQPALHFNLNAETYADLARKFAPGQLLENTTKTADSVLLADVNQDGLMDQLRVHHVPDPKKKNKINTSYVLYLSPADTRPD
jgi:hypothetical protein